ncbi:hypothetical protein M422DRAFT_183544, partial [Sphaerobolus stellatus SS14]
LIQLRTGHVPLNKHLHQIGAWGTPVCMGCELAEETVRQYILECPADVSQRDELRKWVKGRQLELAALLSDKKQVKQLMHFIHDTGRLSTLIRVKRQQAVTREG